MPWMIAPARRAARIASLRGLLRMPVNARCTPFRVRLTPGLHPRAADCASAAISSSALSYRFLRSPMHRCTISRR